MRAGGGKHAIFHRDALAKSPAMEQLAERGARFVVWCQENGRKVPRQPNGRMADTTRPETWARLSECLDAIDRLQASGVGFVLASYLDEAGGHAIVAGIDLDNAIDPVTGAIRPWALEVVRDCNTYAELSPGGGGLKLYGTIDRLIELAAHKLVIQPDNGTKPQQIEAYITARYFALTGAHVDGTPDELCNVTEPFERLGWRLNAHACQRAKDLPEVHLSGAVELTERVKELIRDDPAMARLWAGVKTTGDTSASGLDASLAVLLHRHGCRQDEIEAALRTYPHGQIGAGKLTGRVAERRLRRLIGFARTAVENQARRESRPERDDAAGQTEDRTRAEEDGAGQAAEGEAVEVRPTIVLRGGDRTKVLRQIEAVLRDPARVAPGSILARGVASVVLRYAVDPTKLRIGKAEITLPPCTAYLAPAKPEHMAASLDRTFRFVRTRRGKGGRDVEEPCDCPAELARHVLANASPLPLQAISRAPVLRDDGSVLDQPGYDGRTGVYYAPEIEFPPVPAHPTQEDARRAYERLGRPFRGFPFATEADKAGVVGEVLTLQSRHLLPRAPAFLHNATEAGSGKTKLFEAVSLIALGTNPSLLNAEILDDEAELRKVLTTLTLAAVPLAVFDNLPRGAEIRSSGLSNFLTATVYGDRLLGSNEEVRAATATMIGMTGNACEIAGDNTRRMLRIDLDPGVERPELRAFDFDCEAEARDERGELVVAALTILRAHALAGQPAVPGRGPLGSFEDWDRRVCGALVFAGAPDPLTLLDKTRKVDPERARLAEVLQVLVGVGATGVTMQAREVIRMAEAALHTRSGDEAAEDEARQWLIVLARFASDGKPSAKRLGRYLTTNAGRVVDAMTLVSEFDSHAKTYAFRVTIESERAETRKDAKDRQQAAAAGAEEPAEQAAGFAGFGGVSDSPFQSRDGGRGNPADVDERHIADRGKPRQSPQTPPPPPWHHDAAWSPLFLKARSQEERLAILRRWVAAAGGEMIDDVDVRLPELLDGLALRELRRHCKNLSVRVRTMTKVRP